jgi:hypothetical protein
MLAHLCRYYLSVLDSDDTECTEEGEVFNYQGEDQGQAKKGKPSKLVASLIPVLLMHDLLLFIKMHGLIYCYLSLDSNCCDLAPQVNCYHPYG